MPSTPLYHYTTIDGMLGIIKDRALRITDIRYLNDKTELTLLLERLDQAIKEIDPSDPRYASSPAGSAAPHTGLIRSAPEVFARRMFDQLEVNRLGLGVLGVACFSEDGDQLSQWRGYSRGAQGVALRFDSAGLEWYAGRYTLVKCSYEDDTELSLATARLLELIEGYRTTMFDYESVMNNFLATDVLREAARFKHKAFHDEKEWRLVSPGLGSLSGDFVRGRVMEDVKFRSGAYTAVPYMELPIINEEGSPIVGAIVGPSREPDLAMLSVKLALRPFLGSDEQANTSVTASSIPYRGTL